MKTAFFISFLTLTVSGSIFAQDAIYRCGNEYTNNATDAKNRGCKLVQGGNVTVIAGPAKPSGQGVRLATAGASASSPPNSPRVDANDQKTRDSDARTILEGELRRTQARQAELIKEYNSGEPEKQGAETRNHQKYLDRVSELKAAIARSDEDIAGIKRELTRNSVGSAALK